MPKHFTRFYFLFFGLLNTVALVTAFLDSLHVIVTYFSYFTVLSNILATILFLSVGIFNLKKNKVITLLHGPATLYMSITGIVFWTILHGGHALTISYEWIDLVLHGVMPIAVFVGWLLYPPFKRIPFESAIKWLAFPLLFVFYTLIRGPIVHWYPYPFLNPALVGGYWGVFLYVLGILLGSWFLAIFLIYLANRTKK